MNAVALDSTYVYFYGYRWETNPPDYDTVYYTPILEKRNRSDGSLVWRYVDTPHMITMGIFSDVSDFMCCITCDGEHLFTSCSYISGSHYGMMYQRRDKSDATLDWSQTIVFGFGSSYWAATGIVVDDNYIYALLNGSKTGNYRCFKFSKEDGSSVGAKASWEDATGLLQDIAQDDNYVYISTLKGVGKYSKSDFTKQWFQTFGLSVDSYTQSGGCVDVDGDGVYVGMSVWDYSDQIRRGKIQRRSLIDGSLVYEQEIQQSPEVSNSGIFYLSIKANSDQLIVAGSRDKYYETPYFTYYYWGSLEVFQKSDGARTQLHESFNTFIPTDSTDVRLCGLQIDGHEIYSGGPRDASPDELFGMVKLQQGVTDPVPFYNHTPI